MADDNTRPLEEDEMIEILTAMARNESNGAARIAAIKELRSLRSSKPTKSGFAALDGETENVTSIEDRRKAKG